MAEALKTRLARGALCRGTFVLFLPGGELPLFLAGLGFDFFIFDLEHSAFDLTATREVLRAARGAGIAAIVRVPEATYHLVSRVLDAGAAGIMLPRVEGAEQAASLVRFSRYPPEGERGISTFAGHNDFTRIADVPAFLRRRNEEVLLFVQIETRRGAERCAEIIGTPGIDGCFVGTGDLAMSLGLAGQPGHPEVEALTDRILATARERGRIVSLPLRSPADAARWKARGLTMLTLGTDGVMLTLGARQFLDACAP